MPAAALGPQYPAVLQPRTRPTIDHKYLENKTCPARTCRDILSSFSNHEEIAAIHIWYTLYIQCTYGVYMPVYIQCALGVQHTAYIQCTYSMQGIIRNLYIIQNICEDDYILYRNTGTLCSLPFVILAQRQLELPQKREPQLGKCLCQTDLQISLWGIFLIDD